MVAIENNQKNILSNKLNKTLLIKWRRPYFRLQQCHSQPKYIAPIIINAPTIL